MEKLSMCRICLVENVRMCVVTNKSLQEMYEKLTDVPFVTEDSKPMLACLFCCTRLEQCCQLQRKCVEAEELLAQMLSEDYEEKPLTNRGHLEFVGGLIITPIETISIVDDCLIASDAIKQELPAVCEEQDDVELQPAHHSEELDSEDLYNSHPDVEVHHPSETEEDQLVVVIKIEGEEEYELSEHLRVKKTEKLEQENPEKSYPGVEDIPAHYSESDSKDDVPLMEMKTEAERGQKERRACVTRRAAVTKKPTLKRKLENKIPAKQTTNVPLHSKVIQKIKNLKSESVAKINEPVTSTSQNNLIQLKKHIRVYSGPKRYKCDVCQRSFMHSSQLKEHSGMLNGENSFKCDICQQSFNCKCSLNVHSLTHTGEKRYKCVICQLSFIGKSNLLDHLRKHSDKKPFKCDICKRSFSQRGHFNIHSRVHTGEKPYKCDVCKRSFAVSSYLKRHSRVHSGEKPYKCGVCQRGFWSKYALKIHFRIHSGEKPFKCDLCQCSFILTCQLKQHMQQHTGENNGIFSR